jgi:alpha-galactosidase
MAGLALASIPSSSSATADDVLTSADAPKGSVWIDSLDLATFSQRRGTPKAGKALGGTPLKLAGITYRHGIGSRSISEYVIDLHGNARRFRSMVGLDDSADTGKREGTVRFQIWADERLVADSRVMKVGDAPKLLDADLAGAQTLTMRLDDGGDTSNGDIADWAGALIELADETGIRPEPYKARSAPAPVIAGSDTSLAIHGPLLVGTTPGKAFLYRIPATGEGPLRFATSALPRGLTLDRWSGIISGVIARPGQYDLTLSVRGPKGKATRALRVIAEPGKLAQTPPMGWNSWNVWGEAVDDAKVRAAAEAMVSSGLAAHGYDTVVIDDGWAEGRNADGSIRPNAKFPDMKALTDHVHALGLKIGIYSSPGPKTCARFTGSYQHEAQDAATFARWGFDFLKHDWCSYDDVTPERTLEAFQKPYRIMGEALAAQDRDIIFSLCQYGYGDVWKWGGDVGGNLWRTTGDLLDMWANLDSVGFRQAKRGRFVSRGHWNDTDMLVVGPVGWGPNLRPTRLTPDEQLLHLSLWAMQAAPLFIGADLTRLDPFTLALLTNDEVLDVDRDVLAKAGERLWEKDRLEVWSRPLADGTIAVALFNRGLKPREVRLDWREIGLSGAQPVRDLWRRTDLGAMPDGVSRMVPSHGAVLLKVGKPKPVRL